MTDKKIKYPSINGLRAVSIILVVIHHLSIHKGLFAETGKIIWLKPIINLLKDGQFGVNVFFVISGFLITTLMLNEHAAVGGVSLKNFYIRRTLRIFPAYYFMLLVYFVLHYLDIIYITNASWFTAITYTKYFNLAADWFTAHGWSLSIEEHFYLFWPVVFVYNAKYRKKITVFLILIVPVVRIILHLISTNEINDYTIFTRIDSISTGCLFALYKDEILKKIQHHWKKVFYISIGTIFFMSASHKILHLIGLSFLLIPVGTTHGTIANFAIAFLMMYSVFGPRGAWFRFLNLKIINYIGLLSYSIYLWQQIFTSELDHWATAYPQNVLFIFIAAVSSYHFIEKPFLKLNAKFASHAPEAKA